MAFILCGSISFIELFSDSKGVVDNEAESQNEE